MANKGQGFSEKCRVAEKVEKKEADAGGPTRISGDDMRMKKILFEGLRRDLRSDRCLNLSDRCVLERKNSAGVGQAITGLYQKRDMSCGSATYLGDYGIGYFSSFPHPCEKP